jgi:transcription initiation factor TFIID TATA-box-binding protein
MVKLTVKIENIVSTCKVADSFDLLSLASKLEGAEYRKKRFPGIVYRIDKPKGAFLLFSTGKMVCTGTKSFDDMRTVLRKGLAELDRIGIPHYSNPKFTVQNIVASTNTSCGFIDLEAFAVTIGKNVEYEPEVFPGLVYRIDDPKAVMLIFGTGKVIIAGCKTLQESEKAAEVLRHELETIGFL